MWEVFLRTVLGLPSFVRLPSETLAYWYCVPALKSSPGGKKTPQFIG